MFCALLAVVYFTQAALEREKGHAREREKERERENGQGLLESSCAQQISPVVVALQKELATHTSRRTIAVEQGAYAWQPLLLLEPDCQPLSPQHVLLVP